jgi:hypothetical protein
MPEMITDDLIELLITHTAVPLRVDLGGGRTTPLVSAHFVRTKTEHYILLHPDMIEMTRQLVEGFAEQMKKDSEIKNNISEEITTALGYWPNKKTCCKALVKAFGDSFAAWNRYSADDIERQVHGILMKVGSSSQIRLKEAFALRGYLYE